MVIATKIYDDNSNDKIIIYFLYVNTGNEMYNIKKKIEFINNGEISRERQLYLIKENQFNELKKHKLISLSYINFNIDEDEINDLADNKLERSFFQELKILDDIKFNPSLFLFTKINCIFYIYKELSPREYTTRKIIFNKKHNKTRRA
jgi:hypothetical protein